MKNQSTTLVFSRRRSWQPMAAACAWLAVGCSQPPAGGNSQTPSGCDGGSAPSCSPRPLAVQQVPLVQNTAGAAATDSDLRNAWGLVVEPAGGLWVAQNGAGQARSYDGTGSALVPALTILGPAGGGGSPSGAAYNGSADFSGDRLIFATEDGLLAGWQSGSSAVTRVDRAATAGYKGLALASFGGSNYLYAANFKSGAIDVFDRAYASATLPGAFSDPSVPAGFAPFNVAYLGGALYVSYALPDSDRHDDVAGPGNGYLAMFDTGGRLLRHLVSGGALNSPWGMAIAPPGWGTVTGLLLIGNFGDGRVNTFRPDTGQLPGPLLGPDQNPLVIAGLWGLAPGNGAGSATATAIFYSAGPNGEKDGLLGKLVITP